MRGEIWIADLARAFAALRPSATEERAAIARLLGFQLLAEPVPPPRHPEPEQPPPDKAKPPAPVRRRGRGASPSRRPQPGEVRRRPSGPVMLRAVGHDPAPAVSWTGEPLPTITSEQLRELPPYTPLLAPRSTTAILQTLLSQVVPEGSVDVSLVVERLARQEPITGLPRRGRRSLRFGVQVLIDRGEGMQLFRRDQLEMARRILKVTGKEHTQIRYFSDSPLFGTGPGAVWTWGPYRSPPAGTRVLILSDLGISGRARTRQSDWVSLARLLAARGCTAVALVPYEPARWPAAHSPPFHLVTWDRAVTASTLAMRLR
jgi:hypothetical protein